MTSHRWVISREPVRRGRIRELQVERVDGVEAPATGRRFIITKQEPELRLRSQLVAEVRRFLQEELTAADREKLARAVRKQRQARTALSREVAGRSAEDRFSILAASGDEPTAGVGVLVDTATRGELRVGGDVVKNGRVSFDSIVRAPTSYPDGTTRP